MGSRWILTSPTVEAGFRGWLTNDGSGHGCARSVEKRHGLSNPTALVGLLLRELTPPTPGSTDLLVPSLGWDGTLRKRRGRVRIQRR